MSQQKRLILPSSKQRPGELVTLKDASELNYAFDSKLKIGKTNDILIPFSKVKLSQQQPVRTTEDLGTTPDWIINRQSG